MYVCFLLTHPATIFPHSKWFHGLNAEAIANEKWGIATDRLKKIPNLRAVLLVPPYIDTPVTSSCLLALLVKVMLSRIVECLLVSKHSVDTSSPYEFLVLIRTEIRTKCSQKKDLIRTFFSAKDQC